MEYADQVKFTGKSDQDNGLVNGEMYIFQGARLFDGIPYVWISNMNMPFYGSFAGWVRKDTIAPVGQ